MDSAAKPFEILFVGALVPRKGIDLLIEAARILRDAKLGFRLKIIGEGPLKPMIEDFIVKHHLAEQITLHGWIGRKELGIWYRSADVSCVPSRDEPLATVVLESLVAGTPVVGANVGGIPFMIQSGINGLLVEPGKPEELASALKHLHEQPDLLQRMAQESGREFSKDFPGCAMEEKTCWVRSSKHSIHARRRVAA